MSDASLFHQSSLFAQVINATDTGVVITDNLQPDNPIIYCNPAFQRLTGYKESEIIGRNCRFLQGDDRNQPQREEIRKAIEAGGRCQVEIKNYTKDGDPFWNELIISPITNDSGQVTHFVGIQMDVTRRHNAEAQLKIHSQQLESKLEQHLHNTEHGEKYVESILETLRESILVLDNSMRVISASNHFYNFFKVSPEETEGQLLYKLGNGQWDIPQLRLLLEKVLPNNNPFENFEVDHHFPHIGRKLIMLNAHQVEHKGIYYQRILLAMEDVTDQRLNELQKDDFLSIASHELKTPLTSLKAYFQLAKRDLEPNLTDKSRSLFKSTEENIERLNSLIGDIMDVTKISNGVEQLQLSTFDLRKEVDGAVNTLQPLSREHQIKISGVDSLEIEADKTRINRVITNLLTNAIKYSPDSSDILIHVSEINQRFAKVSVTDQGGGIPEKDQKKIFSRFYRIEGGNNSEQGMGIGLYLCRQIIESHDGNLWVDSDQGKGSTFSFTLPISNNK